MHAWPDPSVPVVAGTPVPLKLFDTADQRVKEVDTTPDANGEVGMYVCGITPYDSTHLGHAATYLTFDLAQRQLLANGHKVHYAQNITDVDDPLFERAERDGVDRDPAARLHRRDGVSRRGDRDGAAASRRRRRLRARPGRHLRLHRRHRAVRLRVQPGPRHHGGVLRGTWRRPGSRGQARSAGRADLARPPRGRARLGLTVRPGPSGLARRVLRDCHQPPGQPLRHPGRRV